MFWSGNFMSMRELNFLLKDKDVTLASVLEADDILQECKADNIALMQFLTRPEILAELITLITEEPPNNVELSQQYRYATIACEVLTSQLSTLSDRLTLDTVQMNRLCDFINKDPPLNPLLASYFSKTVEMLLERSPKQDCYLYHIVCFRVLDFFRSRRDFLPNLLRHMATSAIAHTFKYFIRLDDLFNKPVVEWLEEHQFIDSLVQIICGTYVPEHFPAPDEPEKGQREPSEKELHRDAEPAAHHGTQESNSGSEPSTEPAVEEASAEEKANRAERIAVVAAANASALLCDLVATGCAEEGCSTRSHTAFQLAGALSSCACVRSVLCQVFTCPPRSRAMALHHAARLLLALVHHHTSENEEERCSVELAVAPHLPLLHQALLQHPGHLAQEEGGVISGSGVSVSKRVGWARVSIAALLAQLALSEVEEVATTMLTLGTPGVLIELMFQFPENNFLHAQVVAFCANALSNRLYRTQYARHLFEECDLLTRLMDAFQENDDKLGASPRAGYMGHVLQLMRHVGGAAEGAGAEASERYRALHDARLVHIELLHDTPLGGSYPSENLYDVGEEYGGTAAVANMDDLGDDLATDHEMRSAEEHADGAEFGIAEGLGLGDSDDKRAAAQRSFFQLANHRLDDDVWEDGPEPEELGGAPSPAPAPASAAHHALGGDLSPWESGGSDVSGGEGWAQFDAFCFPSPSPSPGARGSPSPGPGPASAPHSGDRFQPAFTPFWSYESDAPSDPVTGGLRDSMRSLHLESDKLDPAATAELANNLLTAMSAMTPDAIANIVNANLQPLHLPPHPEVSLPPPGDADPPLPPDTDLRVPLASDADTSTRYLRADPTPDPIDVRLPAEADIRAADSPAGDASPGAANSPAAGAQADRLRGDTLATAANITTGTDGLREHAESCDVTAVGGSDGTIVRETPPDPSGDNDIERVKINCVSENVGAFESNSSPNDGNANANNLSPESRVSTTAADVTETVNIPVEHAVEATEGTPGER